MTPIDAAVIATRFVQYLALGLLFGVALFSVRTPGWQAHGLGALALIGAGVSTLGFGLLVAAMSGGVPDYELVRMIAVETPLGNATLLRIGLLLLAIPASLAGPLAVLPLAAVALATLAWSGHGAAGEGMAGWLQLGATVVHLLAGSAWAGALLALLVMTSARVSIARLHAAFAGFATFGTLLVIAIATTGLLNTLMLLGTDPGAWNQLYAGLLMAKVALFGVMIGVAALNRLYLTPALAQHGGRIAIGSSLAIEGLLAISIIAIVSWLGTLSPA